MGPTYKCSPHSLKYDYYSYFIILSLTHLIHWNIIFNPFINFNSFRCFCLMYIRTLKWNMQTDTLRVSFQGIFKLYEVTYINLNQKHLKHKLHAWGAGCLSRSSPLTSLLSGNNSELKRDVFLLELLLAERMSQLRLQKENWCHAPVEQFPVHQKVTLKGNLLPRCLGL